ncbi:unnamed protein product [Ilex paraguariensis]|uniref:DYW domain-containing protein n=1 Tax=Ilex paraguariensis TaxID=185542 RepID=A0ABC8V3F5_9AQUA
MISLSLPSPAKLVPPLLPTSPSHQKPSSSQSLKNPSFEPLKDRLIRQANEGNIRQAISTLDRIAQLGLTPDLTSYSLLLKSCIRTRNFDLGKLVHIKLTDSRLELDSVALNSLISLYSKCGDWVTAKSIFEDMGEKKDLVSWSAMISCLTHSGMELEAIFTFFDMVQSGEYPNQFCFSAAIQACSNVDNAWIGIVIFGFVIKTGYFESDVCVGCALIDLFSKGFSDLNSAKKLFDKMPERNSVSWTLMITRYSQLGQPRTAIEMFLDMVFSGFTPDRFTFSSILSSCSGMGFLFLGKQLHCRVIKSRLSEDVCVGCSLVDMYAKCVVPGSLNDSRKVFDHMPDHNIMSWTAIINGYVQSGGKDGEALELYCKMIDEGRVLPNHFTFSSLLKACGNLSNPELGVQIEDSGFEVDAFTFASLLSGAASIGAGGKGEQIHSRLLKSGFQANQCVCNALVSMYSRCGNIEAAYQTFKELEDRNVVSWTSMITGYAKHGFAKRALEMFHQMLEAGMQPNEVTYIAVLSACSHVGMVDEGWKHFNSMSNEHGISPRMEHYGCMVDLLGRSGFLEKAVQFIYSMPFKADALVWRTLLGACRVHANTELGKHAAKMILEQDPNDPAAYILLSNLYASMGQWEDAVQIRKSMKERKLVKEAGCSWIETENGVHKFYVGDSKHPQAKEIYEELDRLALKIKEIGYVPDTDFVLHDVEEELKERYLFQHSEKIAVAFGLISTSRPKTIRIFKNLRVCGDCHTALKYISKATGREIVVRDSNRFHHIRDGACSCSDYW